MIDIEVTEKGIPYVCSVEENNIFKYIKENKNDLRHLDDEQKILKAIYEIWLEDKGFVEAWDDDIPETSPYYGEKVYKIKNLSLDNIRWIDDRKPSDILRKKELESECKKVLEEALEICLRYVDLDIVGNFYICIDETTLYFDSKNYVFLSGNFHGKYRLKKNRQEVIEKVQNAICKNMKLFQEYCAF